MEYSTYPEQLLLEENRKIRLLRLVTDLLIQVLMTRPVSRQQAERMIAGARSYAANLFPGKEDVFDLVYLPRFRRALDEAGSFARSDVHQRERSADYPE